ncbi:DUF4259 domain-containing protein [uncultured Fusobacterium sp.]|jgi:hypothetical protein|uniref:DUF4259 domain-containing protein n=1 Tax=uncultured Fusobacterium sp. TaxID=159267 RepID=UPI0025E59EC2|nr:DUF4259 domain-containing protein [uncultured Fusobacterium sp.]
MGAWGIKALESDEGLDVIDILENEYIPEHSIMNLEEIIQLMRDEVMLGKDLTEVDFLFDNTAIALTELYFQWKEERKFNYETENNIWKKVTDFISSKKSIDILLKQLIDIKNKVPDEDGEREIVDLWYENGQNPSYEEWYNHLGSLIEKLKAEYKS